jgi:hypothetical protein
MAEAADLTRDPSANDTVTRPYPRGILMRRAFLALTILALCSVPTSAHSYGHGHSYGHFYAPAVFVSPFQSVQQIYVPEPRGPL